MKLTITARAGTVTVHVDDHPDHAGAQHIAAVLSRAITDWLTTHPAAIDAIPTQRARRTHHAAMHRHVAVRRLLVDHLTRPDPRLPFSDRLAHLMTDLAPHLKRTHT